MPLLRTSALSTVSLCLLAQPTARAADPVVIAKPSDGDIVPPEFTARVAYGAVDNCSEGHCDTPTADTVKLYLREPELRLLAECGPCPEDCTPCYPDVAQFEVILEPGNYSISASASYRGHYQLSDIMEITVDENAPSEGCACASTHDGNGYGLAWVGALCLLSTRHRNRRG